MEGKSMLARLKKHKRTILLVAVLLVSSVVLLLRDDQTRRSIWFHIKHHPVFLGTDKRAVVERAEKEFVRKYGPGVLEQRPWQITEENGVYSIVGTFHNIHAVGGVAEMKIRKADGEILEVFHSL